MDIQSTCRLQGSLAAKIFPDHGRGGGGGGGRTWEGGGHGRGHGEGERGLNTGASAGAKVTWGSVKTSPFIRENDQYKKT